MEPLVIIQIFDDEFSTIVNALHSDLADKLADIYDADYVELFDDKIVVHNLPDDEVDVLEYQSRYLTTEELLEFFSTPQVILTP